MVKKEKQQFLMENHVWFCSFRPRSRLELLFFSKTAIFIQICDYMCRLYLHMRMNESDKIITYQEVLRDVTFP